MSALHPIATESPQRKGRARSLPCCSVQQIRQLGEVRRHPPRRRSGILRRRVAKGQERTHATGWSSSALCDRLCQPLKYLEPKTARGSAMEFVRGLQGDIKKLSIL